MIIYCIFLVFWEQLSLLCPNCLFLRNLTKYIPSFNCSVQFLVTLSAPGATPSSICLGEFVPFQDFETHLYI